MHPLVNNLDDLTENELESKLLELNRKYFSTSNPYVKEQIVLIRDSYLIALEEKRRINKNNQQGPDDSGLDNLINVS